MVVLRGQGLIFQYRSCYNLGHPKSCVLCTDLYTGVNGDMYTERETEVVGYRPMRPPPPATTDPQENTCPPPSSHGQYDRCTQLCIQRTVPFRRQNTHCIQIVSPHGDTDLEPMSTLGDTLSVHVWRLIRDGGPLLGTWAGASLGYEQNQPNSVDLEHASKIKIPHGKITPVPLIPITTPGLPNT